MGIWQYNEWLKARSKQVSFIAFGFIPLDQDTCSEVVSVCEHASDKSICCDTDRDPLGFSFKMR